MEAIGRHVYNNLKSYPESELTEEEKAQIEFYESSIRSEEDKEKTRAYWESLLTLEEAVEPSLDKDGFWNQFSSQYKFYYEKRFELTQDAIENLKSIMLYFLKSEEFFSCSRLNSEFSKPSFDKGLLIIGGFGNGKSSIMKAIHLVLQSYPSLSFAYREANQVVTDYEGLQDQSERDSFWKRITNGRAFFDDVKTEPEASNYGKRNLFKDILEKRYASKILTHLSCNYSEEEPGDLEAGLEEFGIKYGGRVYDRLPEMFNIIEFKGQSFRR